MLPAVKPFLVLERWPKETSNSLHVLLYSTNSTKLTQQTRLEVDLPNQVYKTLVLVKHDPAYINSLQDQIMHLASYRSNLLAVVNSTMNTQQLVLFKKRYSENELLKMACPQGLIPRVIGGINVCSTCPAHSYFNINLKTCAKCEADKVCFVGSSLQTSESRKQLNKFNISNVPSLFDEEIEIKKLV